MTRCNFCNKKLNIVEESILCKCEKAFCPKHKESFSHDCSFDFKKQKRDLLRKEQSDLTTNGGLIKI